MLPTPFFSVLFSCRRYLQSNLPANCNVIRFPQYPKVPVYMLVWHSMTSPSTIISNCWWVICSIIIWLVAVPITTQHLLVEHQTTIKKCLFPPELDHVLLSEIKPRGNSSGRYCVRTFEFLLLFKAPAACSSMFSLCEDSPRLQKGCQIWGVYSAFSVCHHRKEGIS